MENKERFKKRLKAIEELSNRLEGGQLSVNELVNLETLTRELYERAIILKYKAFENKVNPIIESPLNIEDEIDFIVNTVEDEIEESEPTIDFSIFDAPEETEKEVIEEQIVLVEEVKEEVAETIAPEVIPEIAREEIKEEVIIETPKVDHTSSQGQAFWEQLNINSNSLSTQFEGAKLVSLVGAFGLNEKLRFINELFDGSSEGFSEAIKALDTQSNLDAAKVKSSELALKHGWDVEEESVVDFLIMVNRRYA